MGNKTLADTLKSFYGHRLQQDDSRTSRLYLNKGNGKSILLAKGYPTSTPSVSISHLYNTGVGIPQDAAHEINEAIKGATLWAQGKVAEAQSILMKLTIFKDLILPGNTMLSEGLNRATGFISAFHEKLKPYIKLYESRSAVYDESNGYTDTIFDIQPNLTIVLYPKLTTQEDFAILNNEGKSTTGFKDKLISPATQLKHILGFLTGRTEYVGINVGTDNYKASNQNTASSKGQTLYIPNPIPTVKGGVAITNDVDLANTDSNDKNEFIRYRKITSPNDYKPDSTRYKYGISGTFRLISGGVSEKIDTNDDTGTVYSDLYGASTRSVTGANFYDNLLISGLNITNSDTNLKMKTFDFDAKTYLNEVTPEYITLNLTFQHAYKKYDFNEVYWALGLSSLEDMQVGSREKAKLKPKFVDVTKSLVQADAEKQVAGKAAKDVGG